MLEIGCGNGEPPARVGTPMFFSHFDAETNLRLLCEAGFEPIEHDVVPMIEEEHGEVRFLWVLARRA